MRAAELHFDAETHTYSRGGLVLPSVTQIMEAVGIIDYRMIPGETRQAALQRGRDVHVLTQFDDENDLDEGSIHPALAGYLAGWRRFRADTELGRLPITLMEHRMHHPILDYAGTLDREFGHRVIVDIKTGPAPWWVRIQLAAYRELRGEVIRRVAVELHPDGTFQMRECPMVEHRNDLDAFNAALRIVRERKAKAWR